MYEEDLSAMDASGAAGFGIGFFLFVIVVYLFYGYCIGRVLQKAGKPLWVGFVPVYNNIVMLEIIGRPVWWIVLLLIPFVNFIVLIITYIDLAKSFGKDTVYGILLFFFGFIMLPVMAFSKDIQYQGPAVTQPGPVI